MWSDWLTPLRVLIRLLALMLAMLVLLVPTVLCQGSFGRSITVGRRQLDEFMLNLWSGTVCRVFGVRRTQHGEVLAGPVLVVANHISWLDIQVLHSVASMSFVAKAEIAQWPLLGYLARKGGTVFHRRGSHDSASDVASQMLKRLESGHRVAIFPEGGILPGVGVKRFHARMFKLAVEADCAVQPVMIRYSQKGLRDDAMTFIDDESFGRNILRIMGRPSCTAELFFLPPFRVEGRQRRELAESAEIAVRSAFENPQE